MKTKKHKFCCVLISERGRGGVFCFLFLFSKDIKIQIHSEIHSKIHSKIRWKIHSKIHSKIHRKSIVKSRVKPAQLFAFYFYFLCSKEQATAQPRFLMIFCEIKTFCSQNKPFFVKHFIFKADLHLFSLTVFYVMGPRPPVACSFENKK